MKSRASSFGTRVAVEGKPRQPAIEWRGRARSESHMQGVNVKSEIGNLKKVILHRPGNEL